MASIKLVCALVFVALAAAQACTQNGPTSPVLRQEVDANARKLYIAWPCACDEHRAQAFVTVDSIPRAAVLTVCNASCTEYAFSIVERCNPLVIQTPDFVSAACAHVDRSCVLVTEDTFAHTHPLLCASVVFLVCILLAYTRKRRRAK